ncbi:MAG: YggS family pyridoxal phosphate-dependent enzyme [Rubrobacteridae bacterium]|nr:YggS family pyridoxal phosphate-dependent enzyme [Rubrobacteridae bacterium]
MPKHDAIKRDINWHFIGHLQRNKVRYIIPFVYLIQSVDSVLLAKEISRRAQDYGKTQDILLEVNVSKEKSKKGFRLEEVESRLEEIADFSNICVKGLMMMAPFTEETDSLRGYFAKLKEVFDDLSYLQGSRIEMKYLSMGMTNDFNIAVEEGSNMVRIGTAFFRTPGGDIYA